MIKSLFDEAEGKTQDEIEKVNQPVSDENGLPEILSANDAEANNLIEMKPIDKSGDERKKAILQDEDNIVPNVTFTLSNPFEPTSAVETQKREIAEPLLFQMQSKPESTAETARKSGLAMSAAIALFGSVVFLLIIGWFADLLLGTSPWGIVGGIVLGSIIGFFQFFRTTSQILKNKD
ncbi:hypothetical protein BH20ACI1_BH20ACI1_29140 [soil metagenome]